MEYMRSINFMFLGGLIMAIAVERTGLHRRVALAVLRLCGSTLFGMMAGFMAATGGLSMFISNTAATSMMVPIVTAAVETISGLDGV